MASFLRSCPPSLLPLPLQSQPSLLPPRAGCLSSSPSAVTLPSMSLPSRPTRRTLGPIFAAADIDGPLETTTTAVANRLKEWWDALRSKPSQLPDSTEWCKRRAQQWLDAFETGFCMLFVALLIRMGIHVLVSLIVAAMLKLYLNVRRE